MKRSLAELQHSLAAAPELALADLLQRYASLVETTTDGCWEVDPHGRITSVNDQCCQMYGGTREQLVGRSVQDFEATRDPEQTVAHIRAILANGYGRFETRHRRLDGTVMDVEVSTTYQSWRHRFVAFLRDITARRRAEATLRETEERYRNLVESAFDGCVIHQDGLITSANQAFARMFDYPLSSITGYPITWILLAEGTPALADPGPEADGASVEIFGRCRDGQTLPLEVVSKHCQVDGKSAVLTAVRDLSERVAAHRAQAALQEQLHHSQKMESVGRLAGGVAHDFNNMLTALDCLLALSLEDLPPGTEGIRAHLHQAQECTKRSVALTRQLLTFARRQTVAPQILDLNDSVGSLLDVIRRLLGEDVALEWSPGADLWPVRLDPGQIGQLLTNLAVNARDAIERHGRLTISTANVARLPERLAAPGIPVEQAYVQLAVADNGCGMTAEVRERIFEPYFTTKEVGKGTGLGLAIVFAIVKQSQGFIEVESEPGRGTTFRIYLPRTEVSADPPPPPPGEETLSGDETVLLVEDDQSILLIAGEALRRNGYAVLECKCPEDALALVQDYQGKIDLLLTDTIMPQMNGLELATAVQQRLPQLRVLFMSGYTSTVLPASVLEDPAQFLPKPFSTRTLLRAIRRALAAAPAAV